MSRTTYRIFPRYVERQRAEDDDATDNKASYTEALEHLEAERDYAQMAPASEKKFQGLRFIAVGMESSRGGWRVTDLNDRSTHLWPYRAKCPTCGAKRVKCDYGTMQGHDAPDGTPCRFAGYAGWEREAPQVTAAETFGAWAPITNYHEVKAELDAAKRFADIDVGRHPTIVFKTLDRAHKYRNRLTEMERKRRILEEAVVNADAGVSPIVAQIDALADELKTVRKRISAARKGKTKAQRSKPNPADVARAAAIKDQLKLLKAQRKDLRKIARAKEKEQIKTIREAYKAAVKVARSERDCYWGTGNNVEAAAEQSFKTADGLPEFISFNGSGTLAVQIQKGAAWTDLFTDAPKNSAHNLVRIDPLPAAAWTGDRSARRANNKTFLHLRAASDTNNKPIWVTFPVCLHRPLPEGARVKWIKAIRRKDGHRYKWTINVSYDVDRDAILKDVPADRAEWVAIDVGWRQFKKEATDDDPNQYPGPGTSKDRPAEDKLTEQEGWVYSQACRLADTDHVDQAYHILRMMPKAVKRLQMRLSGPHTIRVAYWHGSDGRSGEVRLDASYARINQLREKLEGNAKTCFNEFHAELLAWLRANPSALPPNFLTAVKPMFLQRSDKRDFTLTQDILTKRLERWESPSRMHNLYYTWAIWYDLIPHGDSVWADFEAWHHQDHHLIDWIRGIRRTQSGRRREKYRLLAAELTSRYETVYVEDFALPDVIEKPQPEDSTGYRNKVAEQNRRLAGISVLRDALKNACRTRASEYIAVDPQNTTRQCAPCGCCVQWKQAEEVIHTCPGCGVSWDQDLNAAINIGRLGTTGSMDPPTP